MILEDDRDDSLYIYRKHELMQGDIVLIYGLTMETPATMTDVGPIPDLDFDHNTINKMKRRRAYLTSR
jgi:hypothetical protein